MQDPDRLVPCVERSMHYFVFYLFVFFQICTDNPCRCKRERALCSASNALLRNMSVFFQNCTENARTVQRTPAGARGTMLLCSSRNVLHLILSLCPLFRTVRRILAGARGTVLCVQLSVKDLCHRLNVMNNVNMSRSLLSLTAPVSFQWHNNTNILNRLAFNIMIHNIWIETSTKMYTPF